MLFLAVQYNKETDSFNFPMKDLFKDRISPNESLQDLFSSGVEWDKIKNFEHVFDVHKITEYREEIKNFAKDTNYATKDLASFKQYMVDNGKAITRFQTITKAAGSVLKSFGATLGSMAVSWAISEVISLAVTAIDNYVNRVKYAKEALDDFYSSVKDQEDSLSSNEQWIEQNGDRYAKLAKGVDDCGHNVSLTTDEFSEYRNITKEIANMFPEMVSGYNDQNDAIIKNKGNVEALTKAYEDQKKAHYASIRTNAGDTFDKYKNAVEDDSKKRTELGNMMKNGFLNPGYSTPAGSNVPSVWDVLDNDTVYALQEEQRQLRSEGKVGMYTDFSQLTPQLQQKIRDVFTNLNNTIDAESEKVRPILTAYLYGESSGYDDLNDDAKSAVQTFVQNLDSSFFENFDSDVDMESWITQNVINPLKDGIDSEDLAIRIQTLFSLNEKDYKSYADYIKAVTDIINFLANQKDTKGNKVYTDDQINNLKTQFGVGDVDSSGNVSGNALIDETKKKYSGISGINEYIDTLTQDELRYVNGLKGEVKDVEQLKKKVESLNKKPKKKNEKVNDTFMSGWADLDTTDDKTYKNTKKDLLELAEAGKLTTDTFKSVTGAETYFDSINLSAEEAVKRVNQLVDSSKQLSSLKEGISKIQSAYSQKKEDGVVQADTFASMQDEFGNLGKAWDNYKKVLGSTTSTLSQSKQAQNELAKAYLESNNFLTNLVDENGNYDESTKQLYINQLKAMGVENAKQVVESYLENTVTTLTTAHNGLSEQEKKNVGSAADLSNMTAEEIIRLATLKGTSDAAKQALLQLAVQNTKWTDLDASETITQLEKIATLAGVSVNQLKGVAILKDIVSSKKKEKKKKAMKKDLVSWEDPILSGNPLGLDTPQAKVNGITINDLTKKFNKKKNKKKKNKATKLAIDQLLKELGYKDSPTKIRIPDIGKALDDATKKTKDKSKSSKSKTKQEFDWIERRVTVLNNKISLLNAKKDNLFTVKSKNNNLKKQIKEMTKLLGTYSTAYNKYLQKANSVKLDSKLKSKVRNGAINGSYSQLVQSYGEKIANRIQKYMDYYDKAKSSKESWETVQKQIHDAQVERLQNLADKYNDSAELNSARASKSNYSARTQNKYLTKQQKDLEKNYAYQIKIAKANGKINEAKKLQIELDQKLLELEKAKFDNIQNKYTSKLDNNTYQSNYVGNQVDIIEAKGMVASDNYYNKQISISKKRKTLLNQEHAALKKQLSTIEKGTTEYYNALAALRDINLQQQENTKQEIEWNNAKAENDRKKYEAGQNRAGRRITENETLLSFIEHEDSTDSDTGQWTKAGKSRLWAYGYDLGVAQSKKADSGKRLNELQKMLASGNYGKYLTKAKLEEEIDKVISEDQANAKDVYTQRKNLADLVKDHYNQISNYLSDLISKAEESLDNQKDLYDYQKSLNEKTNNIDTIRKQLIALKDDSSEEAMAKKQQLQVSLNEAQDDLKDTVYDKYISDQKNILQKLQEDFKDFLEKYFKDFDALWKEGLTLTKGENGNYLLQKAKSEGNYTPSKETNTNTSNNKNQTSDQQGNKDGTGDIKTGNTLLANTTTPTPPPDTQDPKLTKGNVEAWLKKQNALHKSGYEHLSFPAHNQKYSAINKVISKRFTKKATINNKPGQKAKTKKIGLVLTDKELAKLCEYVGVKTSKKYSKTSPLYKKLKSLGVKGFSKGGVVDVDDINKQVKANGDTTLISAKKGERILTPEQNKAFEKLVDTSLKNTSITSNLNVPNMVNLIKSVPNNIDYGGFTFNFEVLANNPEDLVREVQTNLKYKEALKLATVGQLNGAGRLSVNRIK